MHAKSNSQAAQNSAWRMLKGLRPRPLDLQRIALIRDCDRESLREPEQLESLLLALGLNDEGLDEFPERLHSYCGEGLRIWQFPCQFSRYLAKLIELDVHSYMELGIRHGGSYIATVEVLERFRLLDRAVGVDIIHCESMAQYQRLNPRSKFECVNTQSPEFSEIVRRSAPIDLVFIDSHHEESQCRREFESMRNHAAMIALHDISNVGCPGVGKVWEELRASGEYKCFEFIDQYESKAGPYMGIGLAVSRERLLDGDGIQ